jgi:hypothetical protein|tara:strand:+ start:1522 stop:3372 length:1851 start_codon:yes stop_codon:yes gene_type:complete
MATRLAKFDFKQGFHRESTQYEEEGKWYDGNRVRFRSGKPENMRGYETRVSSTFDGSARDLITYKSANNKRRMVFGTPDKLYESSGDTLTDITPIVTAVTLTSCFGTSSGTARVSCSDAGHNQTAGNYVYFTSTSAIGSSNVSLSGNVYQIVSIMNANSFSISVSADAASTETDAGDATFNYLLPTGNSIAVAGVGFGSALYQATVCASNTRAWNQAASADATDLVFDISQWSLDNWGNDVIANRSGGNIFYFASDASTTPVRATSITTSPISVNSIIVSPNDRHLIALGSNEFSASATVSGTFNPMLVRWSDQDDRTDWTPAATNTSGEVVLTDGTKIIGGVRAKNAINIWTDNSLWLMNYVGPPFTFRFQQAGTNCGMIAQHAAVDYNGVTYWMGYDNFYRYDGQVRTLDCTVRRYVFDRLNLKYKDKVFAGINSEFQEIIWLYASSGSDVSECDSYVIYSPENNYWVYGEMIFTTFADREVFGNTITTGVTASGNNIYNNEPDGVFTANNEVLTSYIESADFDVQDGNAIMFMNKLIPDFDLSTGKLKVKLITKKYPESNSSITKEFDITEQTEKVNFRARGRQAKIRVSCSSQNSSWKWGSIRLGVQGDGGR